VTTGIRSGTGFTRLIGFDSTDPIELRQDGCLARGNERRARKNGANLRKIKAEIRANNENFEVLQGTLVSRMDIHQARTEAMQDETDANLKKGIKASIEGIKEEMRAW
jgi:hypothetical protein